MHDSRFNSSRSASAHQLRFQLTQPFNELTRQNLKKLLGFTHNATLPPVSGKSIIPKADRPKSMPAVCRHVADLRCANCLPEHDRAKNSVMFDTPSCRQNDNNPSSRANDMSGEHQYTSKKGDSSPETAASPLAETSNNIGTSPSDSKDPNKKPSPVERHWTSSFVKAPERRKLTTRHVAGRYPLSAGTTPRKLASLMQKIDQENLSPRPAGPAAGNSSVKLHVTTGAIGTSAPPPRIHEGVFPVTSLTPGVVNNMYDTQETAALPGSAATRGLLGQKISATPTHHGQGHYQSNQPQGKKPSTTIGSLRLKYGVAGLENKGDYYNMDKTAQIMSWLPDVKQKEGYKPRHARQYAVESQQIH